MFDNTTRMKSGSSMQTTRSSCSRRSRFTGTLACVAVGLLIPIVGCGKSTDETKRIAGLTPGNALAFATISLDPAVEQKANLVRFGRALDAKKIQSEDFNENKESLLNDAFKDSGLSYQDDVKPWAGSEVAAIVLPAGDDSDTSNSGFGVAIVVDVDNEKKATAALEKAIDKQREDNVSNDQLMTYRFVEHKVVMTSQSMPWVLDRFSNQVKSADPSLAKTDSFTSLESRVANDRLILAYADVRAISDIATKQMSDKLGTDTFNTDDLKNTTKNLEPYMMVVRAEPSSIKANVITKTSQSTTGTQGVASQAASLPKATLFAMSIFDGRSSIDEALKNLSSKDHRDMLNAFNSATGLDLEADVLPWLGGETTLSVGTGVDPNTLGPKDFALILSSQGVDKPKQSFDILVRAANAAFVNNPQETCTYAQTFPYTQSCTSSPLPYHFESVDVEGAVKAVQLVNDDPSSSDSVPLTPVLVLFDDRMILASDVAYVERIHSADDGEFYSAIKEPDLAGTKDHPVRFNAAFSFDSLIRFLDRLDSEALNDDTRSTLQALNTVTVTASDKDGYSTVELSVSIDGP